MLAAKYTVAFPVQETGSLMFLQSVKLKITEYLTLIPYTDTMSEGIRIALLLILVFTLMVENKGITVSFLKSLTNIVEVADKAFLALQGGGSSLFHLGSIFYVLVYAAREYAWPGTEYKGPALAVLTQEGELVMCGLSRLKGGMAYAKEPKKWAWSKSDSGYWYATCDAQDSISWGIGSILQNAFERDGKGAKPAGVIRVEITGREKLWAASPIKATATSIAPSVKAEDTPWRKNAVKWEGDVRFATDADLKDIQLPAGIPAEWLTIKK